MLPNYKERQPWYTPCRPVLQCRFPAYSWLCEDGGLRNAFKLSLLLDACELRLCNPIRLLDLFSVVLAMVLLYVLTVMS